MYTLEEVKRETLEYFSGDELAWNVWIDKYCLKDSEGNLLEKTPDDMHKRLAKEFARIEQKYPNPLSEEEIYDLFKDFKYIVPQGRVAAGLGANNVYRSLSNCLVLPTPNDSYNSIMYIDTMLVSSAKRGCGYGIDLSKLRPKGSPTKKKVSLSNFTPSVYTSVIRAKRELNRLNLSNYQYDLYEVEIIIKGIVNE